MRMGWWLFIALLSVQIIVLQLLVEHALGGHSVTEYVYALIFVALSAWASYAIMRRLDKVKE